MDVVDVDRRALGLELGHVTRGAGVDVRGEGGRHALAELERDLQAVGARDQPSRAGDAAAVCGLQGDVERLARVRAGGGATWLLTAAAAVRERQSAYLAGLHPDAQPDARVFEPARVTRA